MLLKSKLKQPHNNDTTTKTPDPVPLITLIATCLLNSIISPDALLKSLHPSNRT